MTCLLVYLTTLSQLRKLYSVEWKNNCEAWIGQVVE